MSPRAQSSLRLALMGACAAAFQTLFAREFLAGFSGNEAVLASMLGPWFALTAVGAFAGRAGASPRRVTWLLASYGPVAAATVAAARVLPRWFDLAAAPGPAAAIGYAVVLLAPACVMSGLGFAWLAAGAPDPRPADLTDSPGAADASGPLAAAPDGSGGRAYLAESLGAAFAGAALSVLFLGRVSTFAILGAVVLGAVGAAALGLKRRGAAIALAAGALIAAPFFLLPLDLATAAAQAPGLSVRSRLESAYGAIVATGAPGATTLFVDRRPVATAQDLAGAEETAHLPLALHPAPRAVAIVGIAPMGTARELSRHGVERIDYLVEDEVLLGALQAEYPDLSSPGVRLIAADPRRHLAEHPNTYDAVLLTADEPTSAQQNRTFTAEFFRSASESLRDGGVLAVALPGHAAYASEETRRLHSSIRRTLASVLGEIRVFPLERVFYLGAKGRALPDPAHAADVVSGTLASRGISPVHLTRAALGQMLSADRTAEADRWASLAEGVNRDLRPTTYSVALDRALAEVGDLGVGALALLAAALALGALLVFSPRRRPIQFAVVTSGAASLASQLVVMLAYQAGTGALYREVGLTLAGFMLGAAIGAALGGRTGATGGATVDGRGGTEVGPAPDIPGDAAGRLVARLDLAQVALPVALWVALPWVLKAHGPFSRVLVFALAALIGSFPGAQFAAAARSSAERVGALYAADLLGASIAALVTFTLMVPALGMDGALLALAGLKALSSLALLMPGRGAPAGEPAGRFAPLVPIALGVFVALAATDGSGASLYAFTFLRPYQALAAASLLLAALAAFETAPVRAAVAGLSRRLNLLRERTAVTGGRLLHFALLLPVAAFPIARCYFKVPFVFCHVCPRQCVFGVLRPYAIPAAILANLSGHRFCERLCPLGTAQGACERLGGRRARRISALWIPRLLATAFVALAWFWARADRGEGVSGGPFYSAFFRNAFAPSLWVLGSALFLLGLSLLVRRPFCEALCPVGAASQWTDAALRRFAPRPAASVPAVANSKDRRVFLRRSLAGCGAVLLGEEAFREFALRSSEPGLAMGFRNDAPAELGKFSRPGAYASARGGLVQCTLCPHQCILGENDRGFCRTRVVKRGQLHTVAYGNLCSAHVDPIEKKPLYHYLPRTPILSVAMGGCNLRCLNCQNWEISQKRPEDVAAHEALPDELLAAAASQGVPALAFTYSEPLMSYEYVRDTAALARARGVKNVLVTAGYVNERPLRELCRVLDAVTLDVKAFRESFYKQVSGARLAPVLRTLEVLREEKVWTEVSFLMVPTLSDSPAEIAGFAGWVATHLGAGTPFHILRFHPAHRLDHLPPTPVAAMEEARARAMDAGLAFVYLGNVPGHDSNHTHCPRDGRVLIERDGYDVKRFDLVDGRCPCGEPIPGVWT